MERCNISQNLHVNNILFRFSSGKLVQEEEYTGEMCVLRISRFFSFFLNLVVFRKEAETNTI